MTDQKLATPIEEIRIYLNEGNTEALTQCIEDLSTNDLVFVVGHLARQDQIKLLTLLSPGDAADIIEEIPDSQAAEIMEDLDSARAAAIVGEMTSDEQADLIQELDEEEAEAILQELSTEDASEIRKLVSYDPETAGGIMITEVLVYNEWLTVRETVAKLREQVGSSTEYLIRYIYTRNKAGMPTGVLQMWDMLSATRDTVLADIAKRPTLTVSTDSTLEELEDLFLTHDFYALPVIDETGRICGAVLRKDLLAELVEQQAFDHLETQGIVGGDEIRTMPVWSRARRRLSWLSVNILLNIIAASVIAFHQDVLSSVIALAVFLPIISDMSGCSGNQAVAVSMRELSLGVTRPWEAMRVWIQEISVGWINGAVLGLLIGLTAYLWKGNIYLGIVVAGALAVNTIVAVSIGGTVPLILKKYGVDPAVASGPILTTITDMFGFFLTLTFASLMLTHLQGL